MNPPNRIDEKLLPHLHSLAGKLLAEKNYGWLLQVAQQLCQWGGGTWPKFPRDVQEHFLRVTAREFASNAWAEAGIRHDELPAIVKLTEAELHSMQEQDGSRESSKGKG